MNYWLRVASIFFIFKFINTPQRETCILASATQEVFGTKDRNNDHKLYNARTVFHPKNSSKMFREDCKYCTF